MSDNNPLVVVEKQISEDKTRKGVMKVNEYILYERNISMFLNYTMHQTFKLCSHLKMIKLEDDLYYRLIFCISKNQRIQLEKINILILKNESNAFKEQLWQSYV